MKILIVDDEQHVIKAIRYLINWDQYPECNIYEATNGADAIDIISEHCIDIVFTDMQMPRVDGLNLLRWIQENKNSIQIIAISNHSNFEYVRQVVKSGGIDYLLKPIDPIQLNKAFKKAITEVHKLSKLSKEIIKVNAYTPIYFSKLLSDIISSGLYTPDQIKQICEHFGIKQETTIRLFLIFFPDLKHSAKRLFQNDISLIFFSINNICNEIISEEKGFSFRYLKSENEAIILYWGEETSIHLKLNDIKNWLKKLYDISSIISTSINYNRLSLLKDSYNEAKLALVNRNLNNQSSINVLTYKKVNYNIPFTDLIKKHFANVCLHSKLMDTQLIATSLQGFHQNFISYPYITIKDLTLIYSDFITYLESQFHDFHKEIKDLSFNHINDLITLMEKDLNTILAMYKVNTQQYNLIDETIDYIQKHYTENITLSYLADYFYVSKEHLSRSFKKKMGTTISEYITSLKMEKAEYILQHSDNTIKEISRNLGYKDEKYFSKVFKKYYKCSPKSYRE